ncbi:MAG TPA: secretion system protein [Desulfotomaculum sp.]|nr:secretion system protein [Desulfotomaculum sp.]
MYFVLSILIFIVIFTLFVLGYDLLRGKRDRVLNQLNKINHEASNQQMNQEAFTVEVETAVQGGLNSKHFEKNLVFLNKYYRKTAQKLEKAHLLLKPQEFMLISLGSSLVMIFLLFILASSSFSAAVRNPLVILLLVMLGGAAGFLLPKFYLAQRARKHKHLLNNQLGDMLMLMSNYLRAGHSITRAIELVSREVPPPLADELKKFVKDVNMGGALVESLQALDRRIGDDDLGLVITAILINHQVGGNLAEVLDNIHHTIRERTRLKGEIRALTAEGRLSGIILALIPVAVGVVIFFLNPGFINVLFSEPLGRIMLLLALLLQLVGAMFIRRIVEIEV